jgi:hypothetical protein
VVFPGGFLLLCSKARVKLLVYPIPWPLYVVAEPHLVFVWTLLGFHQYQRSQVAIVHFLPVASVTSFEPWLIWLSVLVLRASVVP